MPATVPSARLSNAENAVVDERKFTAYSMDPANPRNRGKWKAWQRLGYDVHERRQDAVQDVTRQLRASLSDAEPYRRQDTSHGPRCRTDAPLTGPNGRTGTLVCVWQYDIGAEQPRMVSNWLRVHEEGER